MKAVGDGDLLRLALEKIESLQSQIETLNSQSTTPSPTPTVTPRSPHGDSGTAAEVKNPQKKVSPNNATPDDDEPIRTPDGVPVLLMQLDI